MQASRHYDTVAFDVRENASMLFFARTNERGDIDDYLLLMRAAGEDAADLIFLEINETQYPGNELIREAQMSENMLTLLFNGPVKDIGGATELALTFDYSDKNRSAMEAGVFSILVEKLSGGHA